MKEITKEQRTEEWFEARRKGITATDIVAIMGESPFKTPADVYFEKVENVSPEVNEEAVAWGKEHEDEALMEFIDSAHLNEQETHTVPGLVQHDEYPLFLASPDVIILSPEGDCLVEIKCPYSLELPKDAPEYYILQCQWQMLVTGIDVCYLYFWVPGGHMVFEIEGDQELQKRMMAEANKFWADYIIPRKVPPSKVEALDVTQENDEFQEEWHDLTKQYKDANERYKQADKERVAIRKKLIALTDGRRARGFGASLSVAFYPRKDYKTVAERAGLEPIEKDPSKVYRITVR